MGDIFGKGSAPPPAPDYTGAAVATAAGNADAARVATKANRLNQYTPYGNVTYTPGVGGDQDVWRSDISLSPTGQQLLDLQNQSSVSFGNQAVKGLQRVDESLSKPFDFSSVQDVADRAYGNYTARLDPQWQRNDAALESKLRNQGIPVGSEAWTAAMSDQAHAKNDAYTQANTAAIGTMPASYQLATALRQQPLNEVNALRTGSQVTTPQFSAPGQQQTTAGPNYLGAAQSQGQYAGNIYNQEMAQQNAMMQGLFSVGAAAAGGYFKP